MGVESGLTDIHIIPILLDNLIPNRLPIQDHSQFCPPIKFNRSEGFATLRNLLFTTEMCTPRAFLGILTAGGGTVHLGRLEYDSDGAFLRIGSLGGLDHEGIEEVDNVVVP